MDKSAAELSREEFGEALQHARTIYVRLIHW